jgi:protein phosphatase
MQNPQWSGMGATVVTAIVHGELVHVANVGDSRALLFRRGQAPRQLSVDHTYVADQVRQGKMSAQEAMRSPHRHGLTRSLGRRPDVAVEMISPEHIQPGDAVVLCSDGLTDMLTADEIGAVVAQFPGQEAADKLVALANARGGVDNISVIVLQWAGVPDADRETSMPAPEKASSVRWSLLVLALLAVVVLILAVRFFGLGSLEGKSSAPATPTIVRETLFPTAGPTHTAGATSTLLPTRTSLPPTATRTMGPTREMYVTPVLLEPAPVSDVSGRTVRLRWRWEGQLKENEWFDLWMWPRGEGERSIHWTKSSEEDLGPPGGVGVYFWKVRVVRGTPGKPEPVALSSWSETRSFDYKGIAVPPTTGPTVALPTKTPVRELPQPPTHTPAWPTATTVLPTDTPAPPTQTPVLPTDTPVSPTDTPVLPTTTPFLPQPTPTGG